MDIIYRELKKIETFVEADVFVYYAEILERLFTGNREHQMIEQDVETLFALLEKRSEKKDELYFFIQSKGGEIAQSMKIADRLRHYYNKIHFVVYRYAGSAAAYLCLCGDTLYMSRGGYLSDFVPQNLASQDEATFLYEAIYEQLIKYGVFKSCPEQVYHSFVLKILGFPNSPLVNGDGFHGTPLSLNLLEKIMPVTNILETSYIPSPGNEIGYVAPSFKKLNNLVRKKMRQKDLAKLLVFGNECSSLKFNRE